MNLFEITCLSEEVCGDCFQAAGRNMINGDIPDMTLVHAMVTGTAGEVENKRFEHAWNEVGDVVFDKSNGRNIVMRKEQYYALGNIDPTSNDFIRYTIPQALSKMAKNKHWGPWE